MIEVEIGSWIMPPWQILAFVLFMLVWSTVWKGIALWRAAHNSHLKWFIVILIVQTAGILEIIYILFFSKKTKKHHPEHPEHHEHHAPEHKKVALLK